MVLQLEVPSAERTFRDQLRSWLEAHRPEHTFDVDLEHAIFGTIRDMSAWAEEVFAAGYMCISWPREFGGQGLAEQFAAAADEEFARVGIPRPTRGLGEKLVGPSVLAWGTDEQKARLLPNIVDGSARYCQGFSEPDAGSDLASLSTRGTVDGDELVVDGQKVWTSCAVDANMLFCLCRTDSSLPVHKGITFAILPLKRPDGSPNGIEFRAVRQMTGGEEFAETWLTGARAPLGNVIGGLNNGWLVSMTTLAAERSGVTTQHIPFVEQFWEAVEVVRATGRGEDPRVRQILARAYSEVELIRIRGLRQLSETPGGEGASAVASINKICWSEHARSFSEAIVNFCGPRGMLISDEEDAAYNPDRISANFLSTPGLTIAGGTSEILRNVVAERVLGLPKDSR
jgi:alkylation response protein AidB-like acyl-CoA dehydrogenase